MLGTLVTLVLSIGVGFGYLTGGWYNVLGLWMFMLLSISLLVMLVVLCIEDVTIETLYKTLTRAKIARISAFIHAIILVFNAFLLAYNNRIGYALLSFGCVILLTLFAGMIGAYLDQNKKP